MVSDDLFDLFTPVLPSLTKPFIAQYQRKLGIKQVISVPFFLDDEFVGNLFAGTRSSQFAAWEIDSLRTFGYQAAAGLRNARLYDQAEARQEAAVILGRMAFNAAASVHTFRNHVGLIRGNLQILNKIDDLARDDEHRRELFESLLPIVMTRLDEIGTILDELQDPWALKTSTDVNVNRCIEWAASKVVDLEEKWVTLSLKDNLPEIKASKEVLIEVLRSIIKNAVESLAEKGGQRFLWIECRLNTENCIEINIRDNGTGIKPEHLNRAFEILWSTKPRGLGLGLFWARDYIESLGGTVKLDSVWQEGTTCTIRIPLDREKPCKSRS